MTAEESGRMILNQFRVLEATSRLSAYQHRSITTILELLTIDEDAELIDGITFLAVSLDVQET